MPEYPRYAATVPTEVMISICRNTTITRQLKTHITTVAYCGACRFSFTRQRYFEKGNMLSLDMENSNLVAVAMDATQQA